MIVEDDDFDLLAVRRVLRRSGAAVELECVTSLADAVTKLKQHRFDLVLSDLSLPDSYGVETIRKLSRSAAETPIIVLTHCDSEDLGVRLLEAGAQDYLTKRELTPEVLSRAIRHSIQRHEELVASRHLLTEIETARDELARQNARLEKLNAQAQHFVDTVSHEFRTPLTVIREYASLMRDGVAGPVTQEQRRFLGTVEDRVTDLNTIVDDMLDSSRLKTGSIGPRRKTCRVEDVLGTMRDSLEHKAQRRNVRLSFDIESQLPFVYCDPEKARRTLSNLVVNAIKYSGNPGTVVVEIREDIDASGVVFSVTDNGAGIPPESRSRIFDRFDRLGDLDPQNSGFGLGLAIASEMARINFGELNFESEVGIGSRFYFSVPLDHPNCIANRFIQFATQTSEAPFSLAVTAFRVTGELDADAENAIERILFRELTQSDLVKRVGPKEWVIGTATRNTETRAIAARVKQAIEHEGRNRPQGPLPHAEFSPMETWSLPWEHESALIHLSRRLREPRLKTQEFNHAKHVC
ncbi:MAG: hybrid sensor histidine kinase/response regulator [Planctomycetota bacterium]